MKRTTERRVCQNLWAMKAHIGWIKTDYKIQTLLGAVMCFLIFGSLLICLFSREYAFVGGCLAVLFLMPIGAWQVISGIINAFSSDRLQQIYLGVVAVYFGIWYAVDVFHSSYFIVMMVIATIIAVWKYTVVRADYISLKIIDVPKTDDEQLLDA